MKNIQFIINAILLITISITFASTICGQSGDEILVTGNPPLTQRNADEIIRYYERGLNIEFTAEQRDELQTKIANQWRRVQKIDGKSLSAFLASITKINGLGEAKREKIRDELREGVLGDLKSTPSNAVSQFVLSVYENRQQSEATITEKRDFPEKNEDTEEKNASNEAKSESSGSSAAADHFKPIEGGVKMSELSGKWIKGTTASYGYRNTVTNDYRSAFGAANQHEIYAGGNFDYTNYAQISGYGCTSELYTSMKGRASVSGSLVTFNYVSGTVKIEDRCKKSTVTRPAQINAAAYRIERGKDGWRMCEVGKENPSCLYKVIE
jgi:hypothetical protein